MRGIDVGIASANKFYEYMPQRQEKGNLFATTLWRSTNVTQALLNAQPSHLTAARHLLMTSAAFENRTFVLLHNPREYMERDSLFKPLLPSKVRSIFVLN
mmetsp:Transcript_43010/g.58715  ORF Transcript_43010/g.58715 Transcript_43010/m.58715 type:complete len:100 (+) Transcript_43010:544-843(+)